MQTALLQQRQESLETPSPARTATRLTQKTAGKREESTLDVVSWTKAWDEYVRGNVVSHTAAKLIERFLLNTMASSGKAADDSQSEADASEDEEELPPLKLGSLKFQGLLQAAEVDDSLSEKWKASAKARAKAKTSGSELPKKNARLHEYAHSHRMGEKVWRTKTSGAEASERQHPGHMYEDSYQDHMAALSTRTTGDRAFDDAPFDQKRDAAASFNPAGHTDADLDRVLASIMTSSNL